jgi:hypothetical protein
MSTRAEYQDAGGAVLAVSVIRAGSGPGTINDCATTDVAAVEIRWHPVPGRRRHLSD